MAHSRRTKTGNQTTFKLSHPHLVSYDFTSLSTTGMKVIVPPHSSWICPFHWHETESACETLTPFDGHYIISHFFLTGTGSGLVYGDGRAPSKFVMPLSPGHVVSWKPNPDWDSAGETVAFSLKANNEVYDFYRQLFCVNQDAEIYFQLSSTPLWLRAIYAFWGWIPYLGFHVRAWLVERLLWIQLKVIYAKNDYLEYEGTIPYTWPWRHIPAPVYPPEKWKYRERRSRITISRSVLYLCELFGTKMLGMKARYAEYEADSETN